MTKQEPLFTEVQTPPQARTRTAAGGPAPVWLQRMSLVVLVLFCLYIGVTLTVLPWSPHYWEQNGWLRSHTLLYGLMQQGWVRGVLTGLGLLDIWIGVSEAVHYRDYKPEKVESGE